MPELPEVETIVRDLKKTIIGQTIGSVFVDHAKTVAPLTIKEFELQLKGLKISEVSRRAKIIIISLNQISKTAIPYFLLIHLKMTGQLIFTPQKGKIVIGGHPQPGGATDLPNKFTRINLKFKDGGNLYFNDMRKFGWARLMTEDEKNKTLKPYGVEPLSVYFTEDILKNIFTRFKNRSIKKALFDQNYIAGLGNIYIDEACFISGIKPDKQASLLTDSEIKNLRNAIISVLKLSIKSRGTSARNYVTADGTKGGFVKHLKVYGREGKECKTCGTLILKIKHAGRGTHFCPECQK